MEPEEVERVLAESRREAAGDTQPEDGIGFFPSEPDGAWISENFDDLLIWAEESGASDITFNSGQPVWCRVHGEWMPVTGRRIDREAVESLLNYTSMMASASGMVEGGEPLDYPYEKQVARGVRKRFRCNATAVNANAGIGLSVVMRTIPSLPPRVGDLGVEDEIMAAAEPGNGLVLVTGVMGSGKSTLLGAIIRDIRETQRRHILTYEAPVEFNLTDIPGAKGPLTQTNIPTHLESFELAARNAARRAADVILVGESRDKETLRSMIEQSEIGVCAYSTVHTRSVEETPTRILNVFPREDQAGIATTMIASLRLIVQQRLVHKVGGGRIALREYLAFDEASRRRLMRVPVEEIIPAMRELVETKGRPLVRDAEAKFEAGEISGDVYETIRREREMVEDGLA